MTHTPGPWRFGQDGKEPYWHVDMPFTDGSGRYGAYNAMVYTSADDARLVAAAPELLAVCKLLLGGMGDVIEEVDEVAYSDLRMAIMRAEGET